MSTLPLAVFHLHIHQSPMRPDGIPDRLWSVVSACLDKEPGGRPSAADLAQRLKALAQGGLTSAEDASGPDQPAPGPRSQRSGAATVFPAGVASRQPQGRRDRLARRAAAVVAVVLLAVAVTAAMARRDHAPPDRGPGPAVASPRSAAQAAGGPGPSNEALRLEFEDGFDAGPGVVRIVKDASSRGHLGYVRTNEGGDMSLVPHGEGRAVQFPGRSDGTAGSPCPRAVIEVPSTPDLNPGTRSFTYAVDIFASPGQGPRGADVIRKGFATGPTPGQWRMQLEEGGRVGCGVIAKGLSEVHAVTSHVGVTDGAWHRIRCTGSAEALTIEVDETGPQSVPIPAGLVIESPSPVMVGGHGTSQSNDQFSGALDNVVLRIG